MNRLRLQDATRIKRLAVVISLVLSALSVALNPVFGTDGVLYLLAAQTLLEQGLDASLTLYNYPTYPALIAFAHSLTALPFHHAAHLINALCLALLVWSFIRLAERCYPGPVITAAAAAVILLNPELNGIRFDIFRDYGYWAFILLAIERFVAFNESPKIGAALAWFTAIIMAAFFRPEAILLAAAPLIYLVYYPNGIRDSLLRILRLMLLPLLLTSIALIVHFLQISELPASFINALAAKVTHSGSEIDTHFLQLIKQYEETVLDPRNRELAASAVIGSFATVLLIKLLNSLHVVYLIGVIYSLGKEKIRMSRNSRWIIIAWLLLLSCIPVLFLISERFLDERYVTILTLLACLPLTQLMVKLYQRSDYQRFMRWSTGIAVLLMIDSFISFGAKHDHFLSARQWLKQNTPEQAILATNDLRAIYGVSRALDWESSKLLVVMQRFDEKTCEKVDFYIHKHRRDETHSKVRGKAVLEVFYTNNRKHHIDIYRCIKPM